MRTKHVHAYIQLHAKEGLTYTKKGPSLHPGVPMALAARDADLLLPDSSEEGPLWGRRSKGVAGAVGGIIDRAGTLEGVERVGGRDHAELVGEMGVIGQPGTTEGAVLERGLDRGEAELEQLQVLRRKAQAEASRREHWCNSCGRVFQMTPTEILQHKRTHAT